MTVYISANNRSKSNERTYHTDEDCHCFPKNPLPKSLEQVERMGLDECKVCAGEKSDWTYSNDHFEALKAAARND